MAWTPKYLDNSHCLLWLLLAILVYSCNTLPKQKYNQSDVDFSYKFQDDSLIVEVHNTLLCPVTFRAAADDPEVEKMLQKEFPIIIEPLTKITKTYPVDPSKEFVVRRGFRLGSNIDTTRNIILCYPFPEKRKYKIIQGYNGRKSHQTDYSRCALDFNMAIGDTICAAQDGFVVGVIELYKHGGNNIKWRPYANYITVYHPEGNIFTQYVHLDHLGSLVEVGDTVALGQAIAISGNTGYSGGPHLHFNVLGNRSGELKSIEATFEGGIKGIDLKPGLVAKHQK